MGYIKNYFVICFLFFLCCCCFINVLYIVCLFFIALRYREKNVRHTAFVFVHIHGKLATEISQLC